MATPNLEKWNNDLKARYPGLGSFGIYNCRKISGTNTWSQHSWRNAKDVTSSWWSRMQDFEKRLVRTGDFEAGDPRNTPFMENHFVEMDSVARWCRDTQAKYQIRNILWMRRAHYDHIHVDFWPKGINLPPCAGGSLLVKYPDGSTGSSWGESEDNVEELVLTIQKSLNSAGFVDQNGDELEEDGILGPKTAFAMQSRDEAAAAGGGAKDKWARKLANDALAKLQGIHDATAFDSS